MNPPRGKLPSFVRCLWSAFAGICVTWALLAGLHATLEARRQGWWDLGLGWLAFDVWSRWFDWKRPLAAGLLTLLIAGLAESRWGRASPLLTPVRFLHRVFSRLWVVLALAGIAFLLPWGIAWSTRPTPRPGSPSVLMVMIDSLRADHVGWLDSECKTTPNLDRCVEEGVIFENVVSCASWTAPAVASLLTGQTPSWHGLVSNDTEGVHVRGGVLEPDRLTWMELLAGHGWESAFWCNNPNLREPEGLAQGVRHFRDFMVDPRRGPLFKPGPVETVLPDVSQWLAARAGDARPFAAYVHLMEPHYPYDPPAPFRDTFDRTGIDFQMTGRVYLSMMRDPQFRPTITREIVEHLRARYDEEILRMDHYLGPFLADVRRKFPNTVVILVSDHGEEFLDHGFLGHCHSLYQELVKVPLVLWAPELPARRVPWQVRSMDIAPTILELAGVPMPESAGMPIQGVSLIDLEPRNRLAPMEVGGDGQPPFHWRGISDGTWKSVRRLPNIRNEGFLEPPILDAALEGASGEKIPFDRLFDLREDPHEQRDRIEPDRAVAQRLWDEMKAEGWYFSEKRALEFAGSTGGAEDAELLRALGYAAETKSSDR